MKGNIAVYSFLCAFLVCVLPGCATIQEGVDSLYEHLGIYQPGEEHQRVHKPTPPAPKPPPARKPPSPRPSASRRTPLPSKEEFSEKRIEELFGFTDKSEGETKEADEQQVEEKVSIAAQLDAVREACTEMDWTRAERLGVQAGNIGNAPPGERAEGFIFAGAAAFVQGNAKRAKQHFARAVRICPNITLCEEFFTEDMCRLFEQARRSTTH